MQRAASFPFPSRSPLGSPAKPGLLRLGFLRLGFLSLALVGGCSSPGDKNTDLGAADLAGSPGDLSGRDLAGAIDLLNHVFSCSGTDAPGNQSQQATSAITLPSSTGMTYMMDIDGDGRAENQLKSVVQVIALTGTSLQDPINAAVAAGALVYLVSVNAESLDKSSCAGISLQLAQPRTGADPAPRYDGTDTFIKGLGAPAALFGQIVGGQLSSIPPSKLTATQESRFSLSLSILGTVVRVPVRGAYLDGALTTVGGQLVIKNGSLHGAISQTDIDGVVMPGIARSITKLINGDPTGSTSMTLISLFENTANPISANKCMVARDCCHSSPATCRILAEEVKASPIGGVITSDVQVFNDKDEWAPVPNGRNKNGLSIGFGFSSVPATF